MAAGSITLWRATMRTSYRRLHLTAANRSPLEPTTSSHRCVGRDGTLFFASPTRRTNGPWEWNLRKARPETAAAIDLVKVSGSRIPVRMSAFNPTLSPDEKWLAQPLIDGAATNLWLISAADGSMRRITDFGDRAVVIARRVSWSRDSRFIYAAVAEIDADVVVLRNLLPAAGASR